MTNLSIKACGMVTAVGFNSQASCAAMRAGIRNVNKTNLWDSESGEYLTAGRVRLPHWWVGLGKLAELAAPAINECLIAARPLQATQIPVLLGVSSPARPFRFPGIEEQLLGEIEYRLGVRLHSASRVIPRDRVAIVPALSECAKLLSDGKVACCILGGVDSLIRQDLAMNYLNQRRLLTSKNSNGFSLGEAAGAVLVASSAGGGAGELEILGAGMSREKATIESEDPLRGEGLAQAIGGALNGAGLAIEDVHYRISDLNGEHYRFKEMVFAVMKYSRKARPKQYDLFDLWHPIEYIGDVGAAIGPIILGVALHAGVMGYGPGSRVLCTFGNDDGERAAIVTSFRPRGNNS